MIKRIICIFLVLSPWLSFASECSGENIKTKVFYANGMFNQRSDIHFSLMELEQKLGDISFIHDVDFDISYNQSEIWYKQLIEVFAHKSADNWSMFWHYLSSIRAAPSWFRHTVKDIAIDSHNVVYDRDLANHIHQYRTAIDNCNRVLIVAHSQGNFYANNAWSNIYSSRTSKGHLQENFHSLGILSVATPASYVGHWLKQPNDHKPITDYITSTNDKIMVFVRSIYPSTLLGNLTNSHDDPDFLQHNFVSSYLKGNRSGPRMIASIKNILGKLEPLLLSRTPLDSSSIRSVGYIPESQILEVEFESNGSIYRYYGVSEFIYAGLMGAESHGSYLYHNIRTKYQYRKVVDGV